MPKISVIVRKAYGAGLMPMCGPAFGADACLALPSATDRGHGPGAGDQRRLRQPDRRDRRSEERARFVAEQVAEYEADVDLVRLGVRTWWSTRAVPHDELRSELVARFALAPGQGSVLQRPAPRQPAGVSHARRQRWPVSSPTTVGGSKS